MRLRILVLVGVMASVGVAQPPLLHYQFDGPVGDLVTLNVGTFNPGNHPLVGHEEDCASPAGVGSALRGNGAGGSEVSTGYNPAALGAGSWTVGFCIDNSPNPSGATLQYVFGNSFSSWRVFSGGVAGAGNLLMRATGFADTNIIGGAGDNGWVHVAWVYDAVAGQAFGYLNGNLVVTTAQAAFAGWGGSTTNLAFGRYPANAATLRLNNCMEEARLYDRALTQSEISAWTSACLPCLYQTNSPALTMDVNGLTNTISRPIIARVCPGTQVLFNLVAASGAPYELAATVGGTAVPDQLGVPGAKFNIDVSNPSLVFINNLTFPPLTPIVGLPVGAPPIEVDAQAVILTPLAPAGILTSAAVCLDGSASTINSIPGPTGDDSAVLVDVTALPLCSGPVSFYGTSYTQFQVISNGRVMFGAPSTAFTPTVASFLTDAPSLAGWTDLNPAEPGSGQININTAVPGELSITYPNVSVFGGGSSISFEAYYRFSDCSWCIRISTFTGTSTQNVLRGASAGGIGGATDPGAQLFAPGLAGLGTPTDAIYDFNPMNTMPLGDLLLTPSAGAPMGAAGYDWTFF